jgi:fructokinase
VILTAERPWPATATGWRAALLLVINVIDPDAIVLGGGLSAIGMLYDEVPRRWQRYVFSDRVLTRLLAPAHGNSSGVRGAAWLWLPELSG